MKAEKLLMELEALCEQTGYRVRKERGSFRGGDCVVEGDKVILVNKSHPAEVQVRILANVLRSFNMENLYIKPAVRRHLDEIWASLEHHDESPSEEPDN